MAEHYLGVLKASYDYDPDGADEEISIKEGQLLFLKERVDSEYIAAFLCVSWSQSDHPVLAGGRSRSRGSRRRRTPRRALSPPHTLSPCV
jgi:hypothetical protein